MLCNQQLIIGLAASACAMSLSLFLCTHDGHAKAGRGRGHGRHLFVRPAPAMTGMPPHAVLYNNI